MQFRFTGNIDDPNIRPEREIKRPRTYYNVICNCPKTANPETLPARDTLRRKAMLGALVRGSPRKLRPIPIRTKTYSKNIRSYKVPKLPVRISPKKTDSTKGNKANHLIFSYITIIRENTIK